jgi:cellulose biosynthesis protein BcsQ
LEREKRAQIISFVSGKGGVGKTSLAANFAWMSAKNRKTILLDVDLQNQGATGLFAKWVRGNNMGALELILDSTRLPQVMSSLVEVSKNCLFLPAASVVSPPSGFLLASTTTTPDLTKQLALLLRELEEKTQCELFVLDCHGGLDYLSLAAHRLSDRTLVVTEADTVTFNGTLELLSFYTGMPIAALPGTDRRPDAEPHTKSQLIVNRLSTKYKFADLDAVYGALLLKHGDNFDLSSEVLCYIPEEDFVAESFGEYPFCAELAPNSVFAKKVCLMEFELTGERSKGGNERISRKMRSEKFRKRVKRCLISDENKNTQLMVTCFALFTCILTIYCILVTPLIVIVNVGQPPSWLVAIAKSLLFQLPVGILLFWIMITLLRAIWGATRYYSDKYAFKRSLWTVRGAKPTLGERVLLARLQILRVCLFIACLFIGLFVLEIPVLLVGFLLERR